MHELGLLRQMTSTVKSVMSKEGLTECSEISLNIGEMTDIIPPYMRDMWNLAHADLGFPETKLKLNVIPARARCNCCGFEGKINDFNFKCPRCKSENLKIISGREFEIESITAK